MSVCFKIRKYCYKKNCC